jgi:cytochrome b6-f complex iron-sulfur subunit
MENTSINRGQFLKELGLNSAALMAFYCMGTTLSSCSSKTADPTPAPIPTKFDITLDLNSADFSGLKTEGNFVIKDAIIIANAKGTIVAVAKACTHEGTAVTYQKSEDRFHCPNHSSNFTTKGAVINGPASTALKQYKTELLENGSKLRITE